MKRKNTKVRRLSPNEEAQLIREEIQRRRKLRLQQVREQERYIALQIRCEVKERRERELQSLAAELQNEWQKQREERIRSLEKVYKENLRDVGQGHLNAKQNEPDWETLALKKKQNDTRAAERHQTALRNLITQRQTETVQQNRHIEARKKALMVEKERATKISSLPHSAPDPVESIVIQTQLQTKMTSLKHYSMTHYHIPETAVDKETDTEQPTAQEAAALEARHLEQLENDEAHERQEQLERARLRGDHALRKEKSIQNNARLLCELERLQQTELQQRRHMVSTMPAPVIKPLHRQDNLKVERQRDLEIAFQELCTEDKEIRDDMTLPLVPPVLSAKTDSSHECDLDLDVTLEPEEMPCEEQKDAQHESVASQSLSIRSSEETGRMALRRLLDRIRTQRDQWSRREPAEGQGQDRLERTSEEHGLPSMEWQQASSLEEGTVDPSLPENNSKVSEDSIVVGPVHNQDERIPETDRTGCDSREEELKKQQEEQFVLLQELQEKQRSLELQLEEAQLWRQSVQEALQMHLESCSLQETSTSPAPQPPAQEMGSKASPEVVMSPPTSDSMHVQRLKQYQQRLLKQNRLHKKTIDDACRSLEKYKQTLKMRYAPVTMAVAQTPPEPLDNEEIICTFPALPHRTFTHLLNTDPGCPISHETQAVNMNQSHSNVVLEDPLLHNPPLPNPSPAQTTHSNTHITAQPSDLVTGGGLAQQATGFLLDKMPLNDTSELKEVPLVPPAVFLEYIRSKCSQAPPTHHASISQQVLKDSSVVLQEEVLNCDLCLDTKMDKNQEVRDQIRRQRDALQILLGAQHAKASSPGMCDSAVMDPLLVSTTEGLSHSQNQQPSVFRFSERVSSEHPLCDPTRGVRVNPPVSCPPRTLQVLLHDFEQHKLSTIEEVDTPVNVTTDTAAEPCMESSLNSCSLSLTWPTEGSQSTHRSSLGSDTKSKDSTCRSSKLSWRETLQLESAGTSSTKKQHVDKLELVLPHDEVSGVPDVLSSTTISTGSYFSSEPDPNLSTTESSFFSNEFPAKSGASLSCSSSLCALSLSKTPDSSHCSYSLQNIIDKYTKELDQSLRAVHAEPPQENRIAGLSFSTEQNIDAGALSTLQTPILPLQFNVEYNKSFNTTLHDTFQSLSPEITNNDMAECSAFLQPSLKLPGKDSNPTKDTTAFDWLDCGLPQQLSSMDDQSSSTSLGFPQWERTMGNNSELGAAASHEEVSTLQNVGEVTSTLQQRSFDESEIPQSTERLCSQLEEVKHSRELHSCQDAYAKNQGKAKEFKMKTLERLSAKQR